jgi:hypothetical protein
MYCPGAPKAETKIRNMREDKHKKEKRNKIRNKRKRRRN